MDQMDRWIDRSGLIWLLCGGVTFVAVVVVLLILRCWIVVVVDLRFPYPAVTSC